MDNVQRRNIRIGKFLFTVEEIHFNKKVFLINAKKQYYS
jgi:hypothetical protein